MPIYEYRCEHCGDFEEMQRITDPPLARCPKCRRKVKRLISNTSFQLKGTGWYVTDYARSGGANGGKGGDSGSTDAGDKKSDAKADAKANGKSEAKAEKASGSTSEKSAS
jgi:putative FmdB family regulatory protein